MRTKSEKSTVEVRLGTLSRRFLRILKIKNSSVEIFLLSGAEMRRLGRKYLKKKKGHTPAVLSFTEPKRFPHPEKKGRFLGEIYLNKDLGRGGSLRLRQLLLHGLLHILGYSHDKKSDTLKMERLEKKLAKFLGVSC